MMHLLSGEGGEISPYIEAVIQEDAYENSSHEDFESHGWELNVSSSLNIEFKILHELVYMLAPVTTSFIFIVAKWLRYVGRPLLTVVVQSHIL